MTQVLLCKSFDSKLDKQALSLLIVFQQNVKLFKYFLLGYALYFLYTLLFVRMFGCQTSLSNYCYSCFLACVL